MNLNRIFTNNYTYNSSSGRYIGWRRQRSEGFDGLGRINSAVTSSCVRLNGKAQPKCSFINVVKGIGGREDESGKKDRSNCWTKIFSRKKFLNYNSAIANDDNMNNMFIFTNKQFVSNSSTHTECLFIPIKL